jgi:hypothetical protein
MLPPPREESREEREGRLDAGAGLRRLISLCTCIQLEISQRNVLTTLYVWLSVFWKHHQLVRRISLCILSISNEKRKYARLHSSRKEAVTGGRGKCAALGIA